MSKLPFNSMRGRATGKLLGAAFMATAATVSYSKDTFAGCDIQICPADLPAEIDGNGDGIISESFGGNPDYTGGQCVEAAAGIAAQFNGRIAGIDYNWWSTRGGARSDVFAGLEFNSDGTAALVVTSSNQYGYNTGDILGEPQSILSCEAESVFSEPIVVKDPMNPPHLSEATVYFGVDLENLTPDDMQAIDSALRDAAAQGVDFQSAIVEIYGHTSTTASAGYNAGLSARRAEAVASYLRSVGVVHAYARTDSACGEFHLAVPTADNVEEGANRRATMRVYAPEHQAVIASRSCAPLNPVPGFGAQSYFSAMHPN